MSSIDGFLDADRILNMLFRLTGCSSSWLVGAVVMMVGAVEVEKKKRGGTELATSNCTSGFDGDRQGKRERGDG